MYNNVQNAEQIHAYRVAIEAAEVIPVANALRDVLRAALDSGEIDTSTFLEVGALLDEIRERVGEDAKLHARKASRLRDTLVRENDGIVWTVAKRTLGVARQNQANLDEALQEGRIGLVRAIDEFDATRGSSFSTVAALWIRHHVQNCMHRQVDFAKQRSACMPKAVRIAVNRHRALSGRDPMPEEIGVSASDWAKWHEVAHTTSVEDIAANLESNYARFTAEDILADESTSPDAVAANADLTQKLAAEMATMSPRNRELTQALFIEGRALSDVATAMGLANSRVHQLKSVLEKRLRKVLAA